MSKASTTKQQFKSLKPYLEAYGKAIQQDVLRQVVANGKRKGNKFTYNAAPGYLNLHTGQFVQDGKPKWKTIRLEVD